MIQPQHSYPKRKTSRSQTRLGVLVLGLVVAALCARPVLAEVSLESPFLPDSSSMAGGAAGGVLEFRGLTIMGGETYFNILEASKKKGVWVKLNEPLAGFVVKEHLVDGGNDSIMVDYQGRSMKLSLLKAKTGKASAQIAQTAKAAASANPDSNRPVPPPVLNPTPADEDKRLNDVRAEILRRRLQRQQAGQQQGVQQVPSAQKR